MERLNYKLDAILPLVSRPGRYAGNELYAVKKEDARIRVALAFPDVYEIGMSHVGLGILYHILNRIPWVAAERVYAPWGDMEKQLRQASVPLYTLETRRPLCECDIVGFSLQYELQYTNVLNMLELGGIPVRAVERKDSDPLVIGGGPCAFNPEPLAEFFDAFALGDGEEVIREIAESVKANKAKGENRHSLLRDLSQIPGIYVPSFYRPKLNTQEDFQCPEPVVADVSDRIHARILERLAPENYPEKPVVPLIEVTHDRFSMEIMRGCTRGCRFCSAGMVYRPVRQRPVEELVEHARRVIVNTGYEELSLVSLSTSDYSGLPRLLNRLQRLLQGKRVSISFPSLRPDTFTPEIADFAIKFRRSGLTLAPEAGTQRLRDAINKNNREEDLLQALKTAYDRGWQRVKLYFMIGLPTEQEEDLEGIVRLIGKVVKTGRKYGRRDVQVSLSPFSPKAHTPFQWEAQNTIQQLEEKTRFIKERIHWREVKISWRDPRVSQLETLLGRGDRHLGEVIYRVWERGGRFDAWTETFDFSLWESCLAEAGIDSGKFLGRLNDDSPLPWGLIDKGVSTDFLKCERDRAYSAEPSPDCREGKCLGCGLERRISCKDRIKSEPVKEQNFSSDTEYGRKLRTAHSGEVARLVRLQYRKEEPVRFTSHLDTMRVFGRSFRRANITLAVSKGYHAHWKIAPGPPLPLGYTSRAEYVDVEIENRVPAQLKGILNRHLPEGFRVVDIRIEDRKPRSLNQVINLASYRIWLVYDYELPAVEASAREFMQRNVYPVIRRRKEKEKEVDIRRFVQGFAFRNGGIDLDLRLTPEGTARVDEVVQALSEIYEKKLRIQGVTRTGLFIEEHGRRLTPMDVE